MNVNMETKQITPMAIKEEMTWSKEIRKNGITKRISVEKVENGYIITINKYGRDETKKNSTYSDECRKFISKENPFEGEEADGNDKSTDKDSVKTIVKSALESMGGMDM